MTKQEILDSIEIDYGKAQGWLDPEEKDLSKAWQAIMYTITLSRNGREFWKDTYKMGLGHVRKQTCDTFAKRGGHRYLGSDSLERRVYETITNGNMKHRGNWTVNLYPEFRLAQANLLAIIANWSVLTSVDLPDELRCYPRKEDVLESLMVDGTPHLHHMTFEEWCDEFGYDNDSIKAKKTYHSCVGAGIVVARTFTSEEIEILGQEV